jgi:hypothetical protein
MTDQPRRRRSKPRSSPYVLERINPYAAGIDCGSTAHFVAVPPDRDATPVQSFRTFTTDLHRLADWLVTCRVTSVAMEATGVFWIPVYESLEARGLEVHLVMRGMSRTCPVERAMSPTASGCATCRASGSCEAAFGQLMRWSRCGPMSATDRRSSKPPQCTSNACRKP